MDKNLESLIENIRKEDVTLFLGSGFSLKAGAPRSSDIIDALVEDGGISLLDSIPEKDRTSLRIVSDIYEKNKGRNELLRILRETLTFERKDLSDHKSLYKIPHFKTIFTTNYDTLIEDSYPKSERNVVTTNIDCAHTNNKITTIYKIHGNISVQNESESIIITESDYMNFFSSERHELLCQALRGAFVNTHVIFIGYSFEDENIRELKEIIARLLKEHMKEPFLIAPGWDNQKRKTLNDNNITYIDATAEDVLNAIIYELKENIADDFRKRQVSQETYNLFLARNANLYTTTTNHKEKNVIERINAKHGHKKKEKIQFLCSKSIGESIGNRKYNTVFELPDTNLFIPALNIEPSTLQGFSYSANGIKFMGLEELGKLLIYPSITKLYLTFKTKSSYFKEKIKGCSYCEESNLIISASSPICVFKITLIVSGNKVSPGGFKIDFHDEYKNNDLAIKWIGFIVNIFNGMHFYIDIFDNMGLRINGLHLGIKDKIDPSDIIKMKSYYETIKRIEMETDISFDSYDGYSEENARKALFLYNYIQGKPFEYDHPNPPTRLKVGALKQATNTLEEVKSNEYILINHSISLCDFVLNNQTFTIPYVSFVFTKCFIKELNNIDEEHDEIVLRHPPKCRAFCSDHEPTQKEILNMIESN